jgi:hypothetical protein
MQEIAEGDGDFTTETQCVSVVKSVPLRDLRRQLRDLPMSFLFASGLALDPFPSNHWTDTSF